MFKRSLTTALVAISVPVLGGVAIAVANGVDTTPAPVSVSHPNGDDNGVDDPATHDLDDDGTVGTTPATVSTTPATVDDHGGLAGGHGADDPATHDLNDDNGVDDPATHDVNDDHGGSSGGHGSDG